jgi:hypothetical protein
VAGARIRGRLDGQEIINTLYFALETGPITGTNLASLASTLDSWWSGYILPNLSQDYSYTGVEVVDLGAQNGAFAFNDLTSGSGEYAGPALPNNVAMVVTFVTAVRGRSFRGRNYVTAIPEAVVTANAITIAWAAPVAVGYGELLPAGAASPTPFVWVVVSRFAGGSPRPEGIFTPVVDATLRDLTVDSQRRRLPGRGA